VIDSRCRQAGHRLPFGFGEMGNNSIQWVTAVKDCGCKLPCVALQLWLYMCNTVRSHYARILIEHPYMNRSYSGTIQVSLLIRLTPVVMPCKISNSANVTTNFTSMNRYI